MSNHTCNLLQTTNMKVFVPLAILLFCGLASARDDRLSDDCLRGTADKNKCCDGVPDAWYAHLRNPQDCTKFYQCEHGKPTLKDCAAGTHWSVDADRCEWPHEAKCVEDPKPDPTTTSKAPEPNTTSKVPDPTTTSKAPEPTTTSKVPDPTTTSQAPETTTTTVPEPTTTAAPPSTPSPLPEEDSCAPEPVCHQCLNGVFPADLCCRDVQTYHKLNLADASDCGSYFQCVNGHAVQRQCPEGLHWSVNSDRCEWPQIAQCNNSTGKPPGNGGKPPGNGGDQPGNGGDDGNGPVSGDCLSGKASAADCCRNVPYWVDVLLQNNADCHTYIQCVHGKPMVRPCPANLYWSINRNRCEWVENATCTW